MDRAKAAAIQQAIADLVKANPEWGVRVTANRGTKRPKFPVRVRLTDGTERLYTEAVSYVELSEGDEVVECELVDDSLDQSAGRDLASAYLDLLESEEKP